MLRQLFSRVTYSIHLTANTSLVTALARVQATVVTMRLRASHAVPV
ncbi:hypothetical protein Poly59_23640 [Rubripirellula reticaptiva]|uniref:Uncharacterized protein n=1 Tax=Rubripirellula reticaptiva TaxID=2528013 RepID=A0A5C6F671_9BACT|nr:hypothetical protein Poly59_23640 [Rubripirellula reticaptiva]